MLHNCKLVVSRVFGAAAEALRASIEQALAPEAAPSQQQALTTR